MDDKDFPESYNDCVAELETILARLRGDSCDVDTLARQTRRAAALIEHCRTRLTATEEEVAKALEPFRNLE